MMDQKVNISTDYGSVVITCSGIDVLLRAARDPRTQGKSGDDLVKSIQDVAKADIKAVARYDKHGRMRDLVHFKDGKLDDGPNGEAACQAFHENGRVKFEKHFTEDVHQDSINGAPAYQSFDYFGRPQIKVRHQANKPHDGPDRDPAWQVFDDFGRLVRAESYQHGDRVKCWSREEIAGYQQRLDLSEKAKLITAASGNRLTLT